MRLPGRLPGDGGAGRRSGGAARVSPRKDVFAHRQVTNIKVVLLLQLSQILISILFLKHYVSDFRLILFFFPRGPNRLKPFKYNHPQGFFSHR